MIALLIALGVFLPFAAWAAVLESRAAVVDYLDTWRPA
jgi:hypothetical protein